MDDKLHTYIVSELGLEHASPETQEGTVNMLGELIMKELLLSLYETLPSETIKELDAKVESGDMEGLLQYIETAIPNHETLLMNASQKIVGQFKEKFAQTKTA